MTSSPSRQARIFVSYSHRDSRYLERLKVHLTPHLGDGEIEDWLWDDTKILTGSDWFEEIQQALQRVDAAILLVSADFLASRFIQKNELPPLLEAAQKRGVLIMPVILSPCAFQTDKRLSQFQAANDPSHPLLSLPGPQREKGWAQVAQNIYDALCTLRARCSPMAKEGQHTQHAKGQNILIASLGDSPVVVSAMYDLLTKQTMQEKLTIDRLIVLCPSDEKVQKAYRLVREALPELKGDDLLYKDLRFKDADTWENACLFLRELYQLILPYQEKGDTVYLSLAGGRKSMAALMAWIVPFCPCIKGLYYVIDKDEQIGKSHRFLSVDKLADFFDSSYEKFMYAMCPPSGQLKLVPIPFEHGWQLSPAMRSALSALSSDELIKKEYEEEQALIPVQIMMQTEAPLRVEVTEKVIQQFKQLRLWSAAAARAVKNGILKMGEAAVLQQALRNGIEHEIFTFKKKTLHIFEDIDASVHLAFFTEPNDQANYPGSPVSKVVICALEMTMAGTYRSLREITKEEDFSIKGTRSPDDLWVPAAEAESVLIVPLGRYPMVATQLYTLLKHQEDRIIREVVLIYPGLSEEVDDGAKIVQAAFQDQVALQDKEKVPCKCVPVKGEQKGQFEDIDSPEACSQFQKTLEAVIDDVRSRYPPQCKIDLALSGGRKGMTAMTIFAAQRKGIKVVYHTLIADEDLSEEIEDETTIVELKKTRLNKQQLGDHLFLRKYDSDDDAYPYARFKLFRIRVFPAETQ